MHAPAGAEVPGIWLQLYNEGYPFYYHTGVGVQALVIIPDLKLVIVELYDTDGSWTDPGDVGMVLGLMIINARITE